MKACGPSEPNAAAAPTKSSIPPDLRGARDREAPARQDQVGVSRQRGGRRPEQPLEAGASPRRLIASAAPRDRRRSRRAQRRCSSRSVRPPRRRCSPRRWSRACRHHQPRRRRFCLWPNENRPSGRKRRGRKNTWPPVSAKTTTAIATPMASTRSTCASFRQAARGARGTETPPAPRARPLLSVAANSLIRIPHTRQIVTG